MSALSSAQDLNPLSEIEATLKTDVVDILRSCFAALADMDRSTAYETVMNEPTLLHDSFTLLKRDPALFSKVMVNDQGETVPVRDEQTLRCGETLGYIKTLVVRASAKRHFRRKLGGARTVLVAGQKPTGLWQKITVTLGLQQPPPPRKRKVPGRGDLLYQSMRDYLIYDWQARMIPHYAELTVLLVEELGANLLNIREPSELRALAGDEARRAMAQKGKALLLSPASKLMQSGSDSIDSDILWKLWDQMALDRLFETADMIETRKIIAEVTATSKVAIRNLMPILGDDIRLFIVFLFIAFRQLGRAEFRNCFTESGATPWLSKTYADRLAQMREKPAPELEEMAAFFSKVLLPPSKLV